MQARDRATLYDRHVSGRRITFALACLAAAMGSGCGANDAGELPEACRAGPGPVTAALERAPRTVTVRGVRLSGCLPKSSPPTDVQAMGATYLAVAADLAEAARSRPEGAAALRLGYLVGAVERGAARTQGIHTEMVRRLEQEPAELESRSRAYRRGRRAGRRSG